LIAGLIFLLGLSYGIGENVILETISYTFERSFEFVYCLVIVIIHWKNLKYMNTKKKDTTRTPSASARSTPINNPPQNNSTISSENAPSIIIGEG
jgi:hypothetical protein